MLQVIPPPGGWCLSSPDASLQGIAAGVMLSSNDLWNIIGGTLYTLLRTQGYSATQVQRALNVARNANAQTLENEVPEFYELVQGVFEPTAKVVTQMQSTVQAVVSALATLDYRDIPDARDAAISWATARVLGEAYDRVQGDEQTLAGARSYTDEKALAEAFAREQGDLANHAAEQADVDALRAWVETVATDLVNYTAGVTAAREATATLTREYAATVADHAAAIAVDDAATRTNARITVTMAPTWAGTAESLNRAIPPLETDTPEAAPELQGVPTSVPDGVVPAVAALTAATKTLTTIATRCAAPYCREKNTLGRALHDVAGLLEGGALLAFLAEAAHDPAGVAQGIDSLFTTTATDVAGLFGQLVGA